MPRPYGFSPEIVGRVGVPKKRIAFFVVPRMPRPETRWIRSALRAKHQCRRDQGGKADQQTEDKRLERAPALAPPERANLRAKIADGRESAVRKRALALDHPLGH